MDDRIRDHAGASEVGYGSRQSPLASRVPTSNRTGLVIPTLNAGPRWPSCLKALASQSIKLKRYVVIDSASEDATACLARDAGAEVKSIPRNEFSHGGTRKWAVEYLEDCDIIVFLTQDAIPATPFSIELLVNCFEDPRVAVAYGRQVPHYNAHPSEIHARLFNYGYRSEKKDLSQIQRLGAKTFFCSNSFAAYRRAPFMELGGFKTDLILGEDAEYAARAVMAGYVNAYCSEARVYHSHNFKTMEIFKRYFDTGVFHSRNRWLEESFGAHGGEGLKFVRSELSYLRRQAPLQLPGCLLRTSAKFIGYHLGRRECVLPLTLKRRFSGTPNYWRERHPART